MLTNYHSHCNFCDGSSDMEEYIKEAIFQKMSAYGFSSHPPLPFKSSWSMPHSQLNDYSDRIEKLKLKYRNQIKIFKSLEIDFVSNQVGPNSSLFVNLGLDYTIGSVHYLNKESNGNYFCIDGNHDEFLFGLEKYFSGNIQDLVSNYYGCIREMVDTETPTIVGHLDKIKIHNFYFPHFSENDAWYENEVSKTLDSIKKSGAFIEVNTRGYYKNSIETLYPSEKILSEILEKEIPIVLNSDSHVPNELTLGYQHAINTLEKLGFKYIKNFDGKNWINTSISDIQEFLNTQLSEHKFEEVRK